MDEGIRPLSVHVASSTGRMGPAGAVRGIARRLADMQGMFQDAAATQVMVATGNPVVYRYFAADTPDEAPHLRFGTTVVYPGTVGNEFFMTKGHYHAQERTPEVYFCLRGRGCFLMETRDGSTAEEFVEAGQAVYIPPGWAHRSVNVGTEEFVFFYVCSGGVGHDYATFADRGFRKIVVERDGKPIVLANPRFA
ncbi:MAG TPA: glucose-6-phosphate isomerase family protein [Planctomycetota bacterium]|nr:glucose-6-phosphate isomerase family protein [Planctomycetota bacterium]